LSLSGEYFFQPRFVSYFFQIVDVCLQKGSKDNMTALIIKMPAQQIGEGGGVAERRRLRKEAEDNEDDDGS